MHQAPQESACCKDDNFAQVTNIQGSIDTLEKAVFDEKGCNLGLFKIQVFSSLANPFHMKLVGLFVTLGAWRPNGGPFASIQHAKLNPSGVRCQSHLAAQSVNFSDQLAFGEAADGGIARHLAGGIQVDAGQKRGTSHAGGRKGRFDACMAGADHNNVVFFWVNKHEREVTTTDLLLAQQMSGRGLKMKKAARQSSPGGFDFARSAAKSVSVLSLPCA
jgi:hypothetical protein